MRLNELLSETRISLSTLAQEMKIHTCTPWRWARKGAKGVVLETFTIGGRIFTTRQAVARFLAASNSASAAAPLTATPAQRQRAIKSAERELQRAGF